MINKKKETEIKRLLEIAHRDGDILAVILFGSVARHEQTPLSDVDICLVLMPDYRTSEPAAIANKRIGYLKDFSSDIRIFQQLPIYVRVRVLKEGRILFVRDEKLLYELAFRTVKAFENFKHIYYGYLQEVALVRS